MKPYPNFEEQNDISSRNVIKQEPAVVPEKVNDVTAGDQTSAPQMPYVFIVPYDCR
jgi:hypothetical protein